MRITACAKTHLIRPFCIRRAKSRTKSDLKSNGHKLDHCRNEVILRLNKIYCTDNNRECIYIITGQNDSLRSSLSCLVYVEHISDKPSTNTRHFLLSIRLLTTHSQTKNYTLRRSIPAHKSSETPVKKKKITSFLG
jgi:hypothetical protein